jgi:hypothetical protein
MSLATNPEGNANIAGSEFAFVPEELSGQCRSLIESYHSVHGYCHLPDILWHADSRALIQSHKGLAMIFKKAAKERGVKRADAALLRVATIVMALEALARNFAKWGTRFPDGKKEAESLLGEPLIGRRVWFMDTYLKTTPKGVR